MGFLFGLGFFHGISTIIGYLMQILLTHNNYMISKHILLITFLNKLELTCFHTIKWFHLFQSNTNNSIYYQSFVCAQFNVFKYCCVSLTIQLLLFITKNSIKHQSSVYIQLNDQMVLCQTIKFSINTQFKWQTVLFDP